MEGWGEEIERRRRKRRTHNRKGNWEREVNRDNRIDEKKGDGKMGDEK